VPDRVSAQSPPLRLSIVIPAYNEESSILSTLARIDAHLRRQPYAAEVIVVDDHSTDRTRDVVSRFITGKPGYALLENLRNIGKGGSVARGIRAAEGEFILFTDADLSTPIEEVDALLPLFEGGPGHRGWDVVIGSRRRPGARVELRQPVFRESAGRLFSVLVRLITLRGFLDTQCGFKMFRRAAALRIFALQTIPGFGFDVEILFIARRLGFSVLEFPVRWSDSPFTRVRLFRDSRRMFVDLIRIRINSWKGRYNPSTT
jgi:dolichyl-phosphate beta-glucosyltransferase